MNLVKYKSSPGYIVRMGDARIVFDYFGEYETDDEKEIAVLDRLVPRYVRKINDGSKEKKDQSELKQPEVKPETEKKGGRAKSSGK